MLERVDDAVAAHRADLAVAREDRAIERSFLAVQPQLDGSATFYGDKGTLKASVFGYDFIPEGGGQPLHRDVAYELEQFPEDKTEKDLEKHCAPAIRGHMKNFLSCIASREKPVADIEQGYISTASCILANLSMRLGRSLTWDSAKGQVNDSYLRWVVYVPYATPESTGLSTTAVSGGPWLMYPGTPGAHIMISPPKK